MDKFIKSFIKIDMLSSEVKFNFNSESAFKSILGTILTIVILVFVILLSVIWLIPVFNYENPQISVSRILEKDLMINFTEINYPMAFVLIDVSGRPLVNQEKYFKITMFAHLLNGNFSLFEFLKVTKCSYSLLSEFKDMENSFSDLLYPGVINQAFCIPSNQSHFLINNTYGSSYSKFIKLFLSFCDNSTMNNTCKPLDEIQSTIEKYFIYYLSTDISIDHSRIDPVRKIVSYEPFNMNPYILRKQYFNYKKVYYNSDFNLFFNNKTTNTYFQIDSKTWDFTGLGSSVITKNTFYEFTITINSPISDIYTRNYIKVPQIIAQLSSIFSMTVYLFSFLLNSCFSSISSQIVFDGIFQETNFNKISDKCKLQSMFQDSFVNNFIKNDSRNQIKFNKTRGEAKIKNLNSPIMKNSFTDYWEYFQDEISQIVKSNNKSYFRNTFTCKRDALMTSKIKISGDIFENFYDTQFIFTNLIEILNFKESLKNKGIKKND